MDKYDNSLDSNLGITFTLDKKELIVGEIYLITNKINDMKYVGQTFSHRKKGDKYRPFGYLARFAEHMNGNKSKYDANTYFKRSINKYGRDNFEICLIIRCKVDEIDTLEKNYIKKFNTLSKDNGYNLTSGGSSEYFRNNITTHKKIDPESIKKQISTFKKNFIEKDLKDKWTKVALDKNIEKRIEKFKDIILLKSENLEKYIVKTKQNYGRTRYFIEIKGVKTMFYSNYDSDEKTYNRVIEFLKSLVKTSLATQSNCGNLLKASDTTSIEKSIEGPRVMTGSNGNNSEDWTIRSQAPKIKLKIKYKSI